MGAAARGLDLTDLRDEGERVSEKRVARLMRAEGLRARARKRFTSTAMSEHDQPIAANVLARQFDAAQTNQRWVGEGCTYASEDYRTRLAQHGIVCSMSRRRHSTLGQISPAEFERRAGHAA